MKTLREILYVLKNKWLKNTDPEEYSNQLQNYYHANLHSTIKNTVEWFSENRPSDICRVLYTIPASKLNIMPLDKLYEFKNNFANTAIGIFGLEFDNMAKLVLTDAYGHIFIFGLYYSNNEYQLILWNDTGDIQLLNFVTNENILSSDQMSLIRKIMEDYYAKTK